MAKSRTVRSGDRGAQLWPPRPLRSAPRPRTWPSNSWSRKSMNLGLRWILAPSCCQVIPISMQYFMNLKEIIPFFGEFYFRSERGKINIFKNSFPLAPPPLPLHNFIFPRSHHSVLKNYKFWNIAYKTLVLFT